MGQPKKLRPFLERGIGRWLEGHSIIPIRPHIARPYPGFDVSPYEKRQPTFEEMMKWEEQYPNAGIGLVVNYTPDFEKTLNAVRKINFNTNMDLPVYILQKLKDYLEKKKE